MLRWLKNEVKHFLYAICHMITGKQSNEVDAVIKKYTPRDASDLYESILREIEKSGFNHNCTVITSYENISILSKANLIIREESTTKMWLALDNGSVEIAGSIYHGNNYGNLVYRELPYESKEA